MLVATGEVARRPSIIVWKPDSGRAVKVRYSGVGQLAVWQKVGRSSSQVCLDTTVGRGRRDLSGRLGVFEFPSSYPLLRAYCLAPPLPAKPVLRPSPAASLPTRRCRAFTGERSRRCRFLETAATWPPSDVTMTTASPSTTGPTACSGCEKPRR